MINPFKQRKTVAGVVAPLKTILTDLQKLGEALETEDGVLAIDIAQLQNRRRELSLEAREAEAVTMNLSRILEPAKQGETK